MTKTFSQFFFLCGLVRGSADSIIFSLKSFRSIGHRRTGFEQPTDDVLNIDTSRRRKHSTKAFRDSETKVKKKFQCQAAGFKREV